MSATSEIMGYDTGRKRMGGMSAQELNVGDLERLASIVGGGFLAGLGLKRGSLGGLALAALGGGLLYRGLTGHCPAYSSLGISTRARPKGRMASVAAGHGDRVDKTVIINRSCADLYRFWRNFENLPRIMRHVESVRVIDSNHSHWVAKGPLGVRVEWDAEIHTERPNEMISWRSLPGSTMDTAGSVHFQPLGNGQSCELRVELRYNPPGDNLGVALIHLLGETPDQEIEEDLLRFKSEMESSRQGAGELASHARR
jgi:uncharacterized membrane protein